jgi:hypothetical protein
MRILSKIKKNYGDIKDILKIDNIKSITFNGSNLYILANELLIYNFETSNINLLSSNIILNNPTKIEYSDNHVYILDNNSIHNYNILNDTYSLLIPGSINNFTLTGDHIIYDKFTQINRYHKTKKITYKLNGVDGNVIDLVGDNQNIFLCYDTYIHRYNYITGYRSNIITNISNITSIAYDGILLYLRNKDSINVYTKDGLNYSEQKISNITPYTNIYFDGNYLTYQENNMIFKMDENNLFYETIIIDKPIEKINTLINFPKNEILNTTNIYAYNSSDTSFTNNFVYTSNDNIINHVYQTDSNSNSNSYIKQFIYKNDITPKALYFDNKNKDYYILDQNKLIKYTKEINDYKIEVHTSGNIFLPNMVDNLSLWLDSSDNNYIFSDINGLCMANIGDNIGMWKNKANDETQYAIQSNISNMPTLSQNGGINFNGNSSFDSNFNLTMNYTIFLVTDPSQTEGSYYGLSETFDNGPTIISDSNGNYNYHGDNENIQLSTYTYGKNIISMVRSDNINTLGYYNGKRIFNIDGSSDTYLDSSIIDSIGQSIKGNIYEFIIYTQVLDDRKRMLIEGYLSEKWNIKTKLNGDHPLFPNFNPSIQNLNLKNIKGLTLWLDSTDKKTMLDKNLKSVLNKTRISFWKDKSDNNYNVFGKNEPLYLTNGFNNLPTINFSNSNYMMCDIPAGTFKNGITAFVVYEKDNNYNMQEGLISRGIGAKGYPFDIFNNQRSPYGKSTHDISEKNAKTIYSFLINENEFIESVNGTVKMYKNNSSSNNHINDTTSLFYIGTRNDFLTQFTGNISEIILFNRSLSDIEKYEVEGYLGKKWNLTNSLSITHPYNANLIVNPDKISIMNESNSIIITNQRIDNIKLNSNKLIIGEKSLLNNIKCNQIEYCNENGYLYLNDTITNNIYFINTNTNNNVKTISKSNSIINNIYKFENKIIILNSEKQIEILNIQNTKDKKQIHTLNIEPKCMTMYNGNILVGTKNYLLRYDKNYNSIDSITNPFYKGSNNLNITNIDVFSDNIILMDKENNQILILDTTNNNETYRNLIFNQEGMASKPIDFSVDSNTNSIYIALESVILKNNLIGKIISSNISVSINELLNNIIQINNIKYVSELNGILVATTNGLYLLDTNLTTILKTYNNFHNLNGLIYSNNFIYTVSNFELIRYSINHCLAIDNSYIFKSNIIPNFTNITINNYNNPTKITQSYLIDNNQIKEIYNSNIYSLYNYNYSLSSNITNINIIDIVQNDKYLYVLKDDNTIDQIDRNGSLKITYSNIPAKNITIPTNTNDFYYITNDNKIMKYNSVTSNSSLILENRGINVDEQLLYFYNNRGINIYNKNNSSMMCDNEDIYYTKDNQIYNLNANGLTEQLEINFPSQINGLNYDRSNIIVCTKSQVYKFDPCDFPIIKHDIVSNLNNPFKAIFIDNNYYISDTFNHRIVKVNANTFETTNFTIGLNFPRGISYNDGYLYVVDSGIDKIIKIDINNGVQSDYSQTISGIIDLTFNSNLMYITSLLQNIIYKIDLKNNNALSTYLNIDKPYYIDYNSSDNLLISTDKAICNTILSYDELKQLISNKILNVNNLILNNQLYNININFKNWIDEQLEFASNENNINKQINKYTKLEELLNIINTSMEFISLSSSSINSSLEDYKNKTQLTLKSFSSLFNNNIKN